MTDIVITTLNARYHHSAFGLRYLMANMGTLGEQTTMLEFGVNQHTVDMLDAILEQRPTIVGIGVYIWNVEQTTRLVAELKRLRPEICVVLGGPEVSYETDAQEIVRLADFVIAGEADLAFPKLCRQILEGAAGLEKVIQADVPALDDVRMPYDLYWATDIDERVIYVEASRGCPFTCEFCLSALEIPVRQFPLDEFLHAMQSLLDRGVSRFKFVDRTFNLNLKTGRAILDFFLTRYRPGLFLHFEMIPDRLPAALRETISKFPPGALQFEVGIQTYNEDVSDLISRRQDNARVDENLRYLREQTGVHVHADLIAGLPGESLESFAAGFDRLVALRPQEIQVGMLKRLRGTPIVRHDDEWGMVYSPRAPYEILENRLIDFAMFGRLRRFSRYWDLVANSGNFIESTPLVWGEESPFAGFLRFSGWLFARDGRTHGVALLKLAEHLFRFLIDERALPADTVAAVLWRDYQRAGRTDRPHFLRPFGLPPAIRRRPGNAIPARQSRHVKLPE